MPKLRPLLGPCDLEHFLHSAGERLGTSKTTDELLNWHAAGCLDLLIGEGLGPDAVEVAWAVAVTEEIDVDVIFREEEDVPIFQRREAVWSQPRISRSVGLPGPCIGRSCARVAGG